VYGANLRALVVYLLIVQHVPVDRCVRLIADLVGAAVSAGFVHKMLAAVAAAVAEVVKGIKMLITLAAVVHFDETTLRSGKAGVYRQVHPVRARPAQRETVPRHRDRAGVRRGGRARPVRRLRPGR
jgi:hypothetical protein